MLTRLLLLFTLVPLAELALLIKVGQHLGLLWTLGIVILTGIAGASLAKHEGFAVVRQIKQDLSEGIVPTARLLDGVLILAGGLLLLTPGLLTDTLGLLALIPWTREWIKSDLKRRFRRWLAAQNTYQEATKNESR